MRNTKASLIDASCKIDKNYPRFGESLSSKSLLIRPIRVSKKVRSPIGFVYAGKDMSPIVTTGYSVNSLGSHLFAYHDVSRGFSDHI